MLAAHVGEPVAPPIRHRLPTVTIDAAAPKDATADVASAPPVQPRRRRTFWCELANVSVRGWRGVSMVLPDGRSMRRFAVPGVGLVTGAPTDPAPTYRVRIERTEWGYGGDSVRVGIAATIDGARYCFEWRDPDVVPVDCR
jgi:hypothetical protein